MHPVKLYLYDLSNGMASAMSLQMTGRYFEAIWHSSVVVHDTEVFFGQGISVVKPGTSHHGQPIKILDMGTTAIDKETFNQYIEGLREVYKAEKYHLLTFNCNNFSADVVEFLCGHSIPQDILDLPRDFLSTPFGASLRPMIERMFNQGAPSSYRPEASQAVADITATAAGPAVETLTSPLIICSNLASFDSLLTSSDVLIAMFTKDHCPPCSQIKPVFEDLAYKFACQPESSSPQHSKHQKISFVLVDTGLAYSVARRFDIAATPTFLFFCRGKQVDSLKGADQAGLRAQCELVIHQAYPPHPHSKLKVPEITRLLSSTAVVDTPIKFDAASFKFNSFLAALPEATLLQQTYHNTVVPILKKDQQLDRAKALQWNVANEKAWRGLKEEDRFPLVDFLRLACVDEAQTVLLLPSVELVLDYAAAQPEAKLTFMVSLRLLTNALPQLITTHRTQLTKAAIDGLLHNDSKVKTAAATLAFRLAQLECRSRVPWVTVPSAQDVEEEAFETELLSAVLETLRSERDTLVVYRLLAALGLLIYQSAHQEDLRGLYEALGGQDVLESKGQLLEKEGERALVSQVQDMLLA